MKAMAITVPTLSLSVSLCSEATKASTIVASSVDTQQRRSYNPHRTYPAKSPKLPTKPQPDFPSTPLRQTITVSELLKRSNLKTSSANRVFLDESESTYMGFEIWLPSAPKVEKPRSVFNAASLAYIGDCIYELYARRHFLFPPLSIEEYNDCVMAVVRCEAQDAMLQKLINDDYLSEQERDVLRWGKNVGSAKTKTKKRAGVAVYNRASSFETLVGYLYLTNVQRLEEIMLKLGFSSGLSSQSILDEAESYKNGRK